MSPGRGVYDLANKLGHIFGLGRVYLTRNNGTGLPALMEVPTGACPHRVPDGAVQALVTAYPGPDAMLTVEQRAGRPEHLANVLDLGASLAEGALGEAKARAHLSSGKVLYSRPMPPPVVTTKPSRASSWPTALAAAGILVALLAPWQTGHIYIEPPAPMPTPSPLALEEPGTESTMMLADVLRFSSTKGESMTIERRIVMPKKPIDGQDTPPCTSPSKAENGGCWLELKDPPPCPKGAAEHKNACWVPVRGEKPMPMSIDRSVRGRR